MIIKLLEMDKENIICQELILKSIMLLLMEEIFMIIQSKAILRNLLTGGKGMMRAGEGRVRAGEGSGSKKKLKSLLPFHPLTNIEISEYYANEPRFNGIYSRNNLPKTIKKGAYVINLDEYENTGTHWIALFVKPKYSLF